MNSMELDSGQFARRINMFDVITGDINIDGVVIGKNFGKEDAMGLSKDLAEVEVSKKGNVFVTLKRKYDGAKIEINIWADGSQNEIRITPDLMDKEIEPGNFAISLLEESKKWLQNHIEEMPSENSEYAVVYRYEWGKIIAMCNENLHYGLTGGEIKVIY